jgi:exodeoxyribonuclease-3
LVSDTMKENIKDAFIVSDFLGSDHCPLGVELRV